MQQKDPKRKKYRSLAVAAKAEAGSKSDHDTDSPAQSCSDISSSSATTKEECMEESFEGFPEIDESFWSDALSMNSNVLGGSSCLSDPFESLSSSSNNGDDMSFWLKVFMESEDSLELPDI